LKGRDKNRELKRGLCPLFITLFPLSLKKERGIKGG
jgi:hypothetical protein